MEALVIAALIAMWWMSSFSVFLPFLLLLYFNKSLRDMYFAVFFNKVMGPLFGHKFEPIRKQFFRRLEDHLSRRDKSKPLEILEIGIGGGANLQYYPENSNLTAVDTNETFLKMFNANKSNYPQVTYKRTILCTAENMSEVEDSCFDVVLCTHVLCSVSDVESVLKEVKRVLKPGGKFVLLEHQAWPKNTSNYLLQLFAAPLWNVYCNGCCLARNVEESVNRAGFKEVALERLFPPFLWILFQPHVIGVATK